MRILISTWSLQVGGGEVLAMNLAAELQRRGHEVYVFNQRAELIDHDLVARLLPPQVKVLSMADNPKSTFWAYKINALQGLLGRPATFYNQRQQAYLAECLLRYKIDVVSSHATVSDDICAPVVERLGLPLVITEHGEYTKFLQEGRRDFLPVLQVAKRILAVSDYCRHKLERAFPSLPPCRQCTMALLRKLMLPRQLVVRWLFRPKHLYSAWWRGGLRTKAGGTPYKRFSR
ncbi:glycosyltransferase family 4 protein [Hymenobacter sp. 5516J-16]|uniref:glycosyltransferase n=1 Tax=Hymenobacter sp. 5516J-16 TaxID=2932253 RepID=UPI001FCF86C6|nr:glycosyltransferase family 4 protein [Hymenobacter sp. 5516J-16]UOQ76175.1 glycosyltransferase family 4 protein [Hymenobacter sp. 5516J-16]